MQKYDIPSTEGSYASAKNWVVMLCEIQPKDDFLPLKNYTLSWPDSPIMEGLLKDFLDTLNDTLSQRGLNLKWGYRTGNSVYTKIGMQGMFHITNNVDVPKVSITLNGTTYKVKVEKLEKLLKELE